MEQSPRAVIEDAPAAAALSAGTAKRAAARRRAAAASGAATAKAGSRTAGSAAPVPSFQSVLERASASGIRGAEGGGRGGSAASRPSARRTVGRSPAARTAEAPLAGTAGSEGEEPGLPHGSASGFAAATAAVLAPGKRARPAARGSASARSPREGELGAGRVSTAGADVAGPRARVLVVDLRGREGAAAPVTRGRSGSSKGGAGAADATTERTPGAPAGSTASGAPRAAERASDASPRVLRFADTTAQSRQAAARTSPASTPASDFSELLRGEVLRHATVVVRNGGDGEIRLLLEPESLGEVRIRMKVVDDDIEGRIVVASREARELFQENLGSLEAALREQGFLNARLDVSLSDGRERPPESEEPERVVARTVGADEIDRGGRVVVLSDGGGHAVDMVV